MRLVRSLLVLVAAAAIVAPAAAQGMLLIPDSSGDKIWAFDPYDGSLLSNTFIDGSGTLSTPIRVFDSGRGTLFVSDQLEDAVFEYNYDGTLLGTVVDNANHGIDNIRGINVFNSQLYVTVYSGTYGGTIQRFELDGSAQTTWATGVDGPWDIIFRANDALVTDSGTENIEQFNHGGTFMGTFHDSDGDTGIDFPQQLCETSAGNVLAAGFSSPSGIYQYDAAGNQIDYWDLGSSRGVWELGNGNILFTGGTHVGVLDPSSGSSYYVVDESGTSFRHIGYSPIPEPASFLLIGLAGLVLRRR